MSIRESSFQHAKDFGMPSDCVTYMVIEPSISANITANLRNMDTPPGCYIHVGHLSNTHTISMPKTVSNKIKKQCRVIAVSVLLIGCLKRKEINGMEKMKNW